MTYILIRLMLLSVIATISIANDDKCIKVIPIQSWKEVSGIPSAFETPPIVEMTIKYTNSNSGQSKRKISVKKIIEYKGRIYIKAYDFPHKEDRTFRLDRIEGIQMTDGQPFILPYKVNNNVCFK